MFPTSPIGDASKRTLHEDDAQGVCTIYPAGGAPQASGGAGQSGALCGSGGGASTDGGSSGGSGCSTAGAVDGAAVLLALAALGGLGGRRLRLR